MQRSGKYIQGDRLCLENSCFRSIKRRPITGSLSITPSHVSVLHLLGSAEQYGNALGAMSAVFTRLNGCSYANLLQNNFAQSLVFKVALRALFRCRVAPSTVTPSHLPIGPLLPNDSSLCTCSVASNLGGRF